MTLNPNMKLIDAYHLYGDRLTTAIIDGKFRVIVMNVEEQP